MTSPLSARDAIEMIMAELVDIPAGATLIGSTPEIIDRELAAPDLAGVHRAWLAKELPRHTVTLPGYRIGRVPVTEAQVNGLAAETGLRPRFAVGPDHPASLDPDDAHTLVVALRELSGLPIGLPTEQEWVRAARGDDDRTYPWGDDWAEGHANLAGSSRGGTSPVGAYPSGRSAFGLLDLAGNVDELTASRYAPFPGAPADVPAVESWALSPLVTKGGGFMHARDLARCDRRHGVYAAGEPLGLRIVVRE